MIWFEKKMEQTAL